MPDLATADEIVTPGALATSPADGRRSGRRSRTGLGPSFWLPAAWIALVGFAAAFAAVLPLQNPLKSDYAHVAVGPGTGGHLLGTDEIGRDILARLVYGARVSLTVGLVAIGVGMIIGGLIGLLAGYYRGRIETALMGLVDIMLAFPALVLVIAITAFLGQSLRNVTVAGRGRRRARVRPGDARRHPLVQLGATSSPRRAGWGRRTAAFCSARCCPTWPCPSPASPLSSWAWPSSPKAAWPSSG